MAEKLKPGDVIRFSYTAKSSNDPNPIVLFLDKYEGLVHGLNFNYMTQSERRHFYLVFKIKYYS